MKVRELLELLEDLDGEMEVSIAYQPNYPLAADATHVMVRGGEVYICQRCDGAATPPAGCSRATGATPRMSPRTRRSEPCE